MSSKIFNWKLSCLYVFANLCQNPSRGIQAWEKALIYLRIHQCCKSTKSPTSRIQTWRFLWFFFPFPLITLPASLRSQMLRTKRSVEDPVRVRCPPRARCPSPLPAAWPQAVLQHLLCARWDRTQPGSALPSLGTWPRAQWRQRKDLHWAHWSSVKLLGNCLSERCHRHWVSVPAGLGINVWRRPSFILGIRGCVFWQPTQRKAPF